MLKAVLFDLVGTLLDFGDGRLLRMGMRVSSIWAIYRNLRLQGLSVPPLVPFATIAARKTRELEALAGANSAQKNLRVTIPRILQHMRVPIERFDVTWCMNALYDGTRKYVSLFEDTLEVLKAIEQRGLAMGLVSNTVWPSELHERDLTDFGIDAYLRARTYSSEFGRSKPDPRIFTHTLDRLGVRPEEAIFVGDRMRQDVWGPQHVGMRAVLIEVPYRKEEIGGICPDGRIRFLRELLPLVDRWMA
ncbi:MAG: HAD family hydrolase [Anaerolineae bacterium]|nr:HAD family hydrolase [Anaerolineae bacterium]